MLKSHSRDYVIDRVYQSRQKHLSKLWSFYSRCAFKFEVIQAHVDVFVEYLTVFAQVVGCQILAPRADRAPDLCLARPTLSD